jgi:hypothetical protein
MGLILLEICVFCISVKSSLACRALEPILKVGWKFWTSSFHLKNFERILGSKIVHVQGLRLVGQPILGVHTRNTVFVIPTPLFVCGNLRNKKAWMTLCWFSWTQGLGLNPWFHLLYCTCLITYSSNIHLLHYFKLSSSATIKVRNKNS